MWTEMVEQSALGRALHHVSQVEMLLGQAQAQSEVDVAKVILHEKREELQKIRADAFDYITSGEPLATIEGAPPTYEADPPAYQA
jgi:hypothetical protein